ncbi:canalicular multispecific organic anion transporter 2-like [Patiria miniata]|uniref:ABC transporter TMD0 domain-containing protein n=1 Tax=Patiria miniata TaxID=46514 RepID=A0A914AJS9_PATMI|nr:canalicular multispecific organic anion transporter 2-like [Patiria miniata]
MHWNDFCGGWQLWEPSLLNSTRPDLSPCFEETVLSWLPLVFLWALAPFYLCYMQRHDRGCIRVSCLHRTKMLLTVLSIIVPLVEVCFTVVQIFSSPEGTAPVYLVTPAVITLTMMLVFFIIHTERIRGRHTSGILFCFWLLLAVCFVPEFNSKIILVSEETDQDMFRVVTFFVFYALVLAQLVCSSIADDLPLYSPVRSDRVSTTILFLAFHDDG